MKKKIEKKRRTSNVDESIKINDLIKIDEIIANAFVQNFCETTTTNFCLIDTNEFDD